MQCELCGKNEEKLIDAIVEGTMISICKNCSKFGHVVPVKKPIIRTEIPTKKIIIEEQRVFELVDKDIAIKIKQERERLNLKQEELAQKLAEKTSTIQNIESGHLKPSLELTKKLENFFNIILIEKYKEEGYKKSLDFANSDLTVGDLMSIKKKNE